MARDTFGQYGLSFKAPTFDFSGLGALYSNKVKRDELIDLARKKRIQDKYGADFMLSGAPVKPPTPDFGPSPLETPVDPRLVNSGIFGTGDGFKIQGGDAGRADEQYMEDLAAFQDPSNTYYMTPTDRTYGPNEDVQLQKDDTFKLLDDGSTVVTRGEKTPYSYSGDPEMDEYNKQKAIYDEMVAAGFTPGSTLGEQTFNQLAEVETIGADREASMRELGYDVIKDSSSMREERYRRRGTIGEELRTVEGELVDHLNGTTPLDKETLKQKYKRYNQLLSRYDATGTRYQGAVSVFDLQNAVDKELKEDIKEGRESSKFKTDAKKAVTKYVEDSVKKFNDARKNISKDYNQIINNAKMFTAEYNLGKISNTSYQTLLKTINKVIEPTSAVMQGEADAFVGGTILEFWKREFSSVKNTVKKLTEKDKGSGYNPADFRELGQTYNALITVVEGLKDEIRNGSDTYVDKTIAQGREQFSDSLDEKELNLLLDPVRIKSMATGQLFIRKLPTDKLNTELYGGIDTPRPKPLATEEATEEDY